MSIKILNYTKDVASVIEDLKRKGVKFITCSEEEAIEYLKKGDNLFLVPLYLSDFDKDTTDKSSSTFIDLDFAYLIDLYEIDDEVKTVVFRMITQIERFLRGRVKRAFKSLDEQRGQDIVNEFLNLDYEGGLQDSQNQDSNQKENKPNKMRIHNGIINRQNDKDAKAILSKYHVDLSKKIQDIPPEDFIKLLTFGELILFYAYCTHEYDLDDFRYVRILKEVRNLRNAVDHGKCILVGLGESSNYVSRGLIVNYLVGLGVYEEQLTDKLANPRVRQLVCTIYMFNVLVKDRRQKRRIKSIIEKLFMERLPLHHEYYANNYLLRSNYYFFKEIFRIES